MTRAAYFDLANGISGDMTLAALAHAGRRLGERVEDGIVECIASLDLDCTVSFVDDERGSFTCLRADVKTDGRRHSASALRDSIVTASAPESARGRALAAMDALIAAEAAVHGVDIADVHLHELASADTATDLLGAAVGLHALGIEEVSAAPVPVPTGWISSEHGELPLPAPVTLELLQGAALRGVEGAGELVTPSGAAILVAHAATFGPVPEMTLLAAGVGAGTRITKRPNISRVLIGERARTTAGPRIETCVVLETNIDDQTPQALAHAVEELLSAGALDAWVTPIVMKKSRPAFLLSALVRADDETSITERIFRATTTLGVRRRETTRVVLDREQMTIRMQGYEVRVKVARLRDEVVNVAPEFADCVAVSNATGIPTKDVHAEAVAAARSALGE